VPANASTVESIPPEQIIAEVPIASPDASTQLARAPEPVKTGATVMRLGDAPPAKRPIGLIIAIAAVCAGGAAAAMYFAMRTPPAPPEPHTSVEPAHAPPVPELPKSGSSVPTKGQIDIASGSAASAGAGPEIGPGSSSGSAADAGSAHVSASAGSAKRPPAPPSPPPPPARHDEPTLGDDAIAQQLKDADAALAGGNVDLAWRLANGAINNGSAGQRSYAHGIHGQIECVSHNNAEGAAIDLRQARGSARQRILKACHAQNLLMEEH
jgi:hypothetical protein